MTTRDHNCNEDLMLMAGGPAKGLPSSHTVQPEDLLACKFDTMASKWVDFTHISQCSSLMATMAAPHCGAILCRVSARYTSSSTVV